MRLSFHEQAVEGRAPAELTDNNNKAVAASRVTSGRFTGFVVKLTILRTVCSVRLRRRLVNAALCQVKAVSHPIFRPSRRR
jgi:hypothetical protein